MMVTRRQIRKELEELAEMVEASAARRERYIHEEEEGKRTYYDDGLVCAGIGRISTCTNTAVYLADRLGGVVYGYSIDDNPEAQLGQNEFGHDFAVIDDRWLVDFWARDTYDMRDLYDLHNPRDLRIVTRQYGPRKNWKRMSLEHFSEALKFMRRQKEPS